MKNWTHGPGTKALISEPPGGSWSFLRVLSASRGPLLTFSSDSPPPVLSSALLSLSLGLSLFLLFFFFSFLTCLPYINEYVYFSCILWKFSNIQQTWKNFTANTFLPTTWILGFTLLLHHVSIYLSILLSVFLFDAFQSNLSLSVYCHLNTWTCISVIRVQDLFIVFFPLLWNLHTTKYTNLKCMFSESCQMQAPV